MLSEGIEICIIMLVFVSGIVLFWWILEAMHLFDEHKSFKSDGKFKQ